MAVARRSSARRTNRAIVLTALLVVAGSAAAAVFGDRTAPETDSADTTIPEKPQVDGSGIRPAETSRSWFDHGTAREQFDYAMTKLSCDTMNTFLTVDVCAVATAKSGSFMLVGTESFWEPTDLDADGTAWVPFDLTSFTMRRDGEFPRAVSVLDGYTEKAYTSRTAQVDLYRAEVNGDDVLVLVKRQSNPNADPYDYTEEVQVLAVSPSGAPTLVASYSGADIEVSSTGSALLVTSLRYPSPTDDNAPNMEWYTRITLSPSDRDPYSWDESVTSGARPMPADKGMTLVDTYKFPSRKGGNGTNNSGDSGAGNA